MLRRNVARARGFAGQGRHLFAMPRRVAAFYLRAFWTALRTRDGYTSIIATRPSDAVQLIELARGRRSVVELGPARRGRRSRSRSPTAAAASSATTPRPTPSASATSR
jgi:hypothetical protein